MIAPDNDSDTPKENQDGSSNSRRPLSGTLLHIARAIWIVLAVFSLGMFIIAIPQHIIYLSSNLPVETAAALMQLNMTVDMYVGYRLLHDVLLVLGYSITALAIFRSRSNDWMALFTSLGLIAFGVGVAPLESDISPLNSLAMYHPALEIPLALLQGAGLGMFLLIFYLFPDGMFVPRWTRPLAVFWGVWGASWTLFGNQAIHVADAPLLVRYFMRMFIPNVSQLEQIGYNMRQYGLWLVLALWFASGVIAQIYRHTHVSTTLQRRQTKWAVFGLVTAAIVYFTIRLLPPFLLTSLQDPGLFSLRFELFSLPFTTLALLLVPISFSISMQRYRLWDVDFLINRTLLYFGLTAAVVMFYVVVVLVVQIIFSSLYGMQSTLILILSTLGLAALFTPLRRVFQRFIDRRFFREKVSFRQAFTSFSSEVRTIIDLPELLRTLVHRTIEILYIHYGAVYLLDETGELEIGEARSLPADAPQEWTPKIEQLTRLRLGQVISQPKDPMFPLLVPLLSPQTSAAGNPSTGLLGVMALGPLRSGLHYDREDQALLLSLADQAGASIYVARLIAEAQQETERRLEAETHLETYRLSPAGQAEMLAQEILQQPETALPRIHDLADRAGLEPECAGQIAALPQALEAQDSTPLTLLAEGFNYLYQGQFTPQLVPIGLQSVTQGLERLVKMPGYLSSAGAQEMAAALNVYQTCLQVYQANSITEIIDYDAPCLVDAPDLQAAPPAEIDEAAPTEPGRPIQAVETTETAEDVPCGAVPTYLARLTRVLRELLPIAEALHAAERVDAPTDKLAYLARAVNDLRHVDHLARTDLGSVDQPVLEQIAGSWLVTITNTMSELQTSARIVCRLLTRHTWQGDIVSLALSLHNQGRGAALELRLNLAPSEDFSILDEAAHVERLAPGEETQVLLRVRPHLPPDTDHFRARFVLLYTDPRGPDQVENFADVVHLLVTGGDFMPIPNPYVVGTPLKTGSPLFFGRDDVVRFIKNNLDAGHRNNLVLIGQRRTGKTSLLKQLPDRLGDDILPVYLDGQTLGLDPGMPNFFLNLATEIAFALEDRGFEIESPALEDFQASPSQAFEHDFLERVFECIGERHLLIMFDEFEELETAVNRGALDPSVFGFLRHLIQHHENMSVIFCGTHRLEQLAADYWNILFNISLYQHIAFLEQEEALKLIQEPVASYNMKYDDLALDKIWRITAGHPYFLQLLCHNLVNLHNKNGRSYVTIADVNAALEEILASGEAHFVYIWTESSQPERLALTALSRLIPLNGQVTPAQVIDFFEERGLALDRQVVDDALHNLVLRDLIQQGVDGLASSALTGGDAYRWKLGLIGLWVEKYKSLSRVINEGAS